MSLNWVFNVNYGRKVINNYKIKNDKTNYGKKVNTYLQLVVNIGNTVKKTRNIV